jgi:hemerythrin
MYQWDTSLETGFEEIDNQHKQWIAALNSIIEAIQQGKGKEEIIKTLDFLVNYTETHFSAEEELMKEFNYADYPLHKRLHEEFKITVDNLNKQMASEGPSDDLTTSVVYSIGDWLRNHIKSDDFRMAVYFKTKANAETL